MAKNPAAREDKIKHLLAHNVEEIIDQEHLGAVLRGGKKLRIKFGIDPTGSKIHIGRAVVLWKLKEFQDLGHKVVLIIGDYTARIGDPSDKLEKRPFLADQQIKANLKNYLPQIGKILDLKKVEVRYNSEWLKKLKFLDVLQLMDLFTASQMIERRNFWERWQKEEEISLREFMYPIMQGYDSVAVKADVELGGTDQLFNLKAGRKLQEYFGQKPQDILMTSMIMGLDGRKMSTSWGNVINITDSAEEQFGKIMSMRDEMIIPYFRSAAGVPEEEVKAFEAELKRGTNPKGIKAALAQTIAARYHGERAAEKAAEKWENIFSKKEVQAADLPELKLAPEENLLAAVMASGVVKSKSEARRLIEQGAVSIDNQPLKNMQVTLKFDGGEILKVGKRHFFKIKV